MIKKEEKKKEKTSEAIAANLVNFSLRSPFFCVAVVVKREIGWKGKKSSANRVETIFQVIEAIYIHIQ